MAFVQSRYYLRSMGRPYIYAPLPSANHIRVLVLAPAEDVDAALECSIDVEHIDDAVVEYEAISYTWGDQGMTERLICGESIISITPNLASALLCLRCRFAPRRLWADAVCINQEDLREKSKQIPLMATIFRSATQVRVWLGNGDQGESRALADIASLVRKVSPTRSCVSHAAVNDREHESETSQALLRLKDPVKEIFRMPWFGRRWIVQELVLNGNVMFHCGMSQISWPSLHLAFDALSNSPWFDELGGRNARKVRELNRLWRTWCFANVSTMNRGIYSLMHSFQELGCKEPKDKLYAIAGLADDVHFTLQSSTALSSAMPVIIPNYDPMVTAGEVFHDLAFKMIRSGKVFDTLAHAGASGTLEAGRPLPSWVPDVRQPELWPLTASEGQAEFKLVEVCEASNRTLSLKLEVWEFRKLSLRQQQNESNILSRRRELLASSLLRPNEDDYRRTISPYFDEDASSMPEWWSCSVGDVFKAPEGLIAKNGLDLEQDIVNWLNHHVNKDEPGHDASNMTLPHGPHHMLWSVILSQLLTENGPESQAMDRLGPPAQWQRLFEHRKHESEFSLQLKRALLTRTIFYGQPVRKFLTKKFLFARHCTYLGFGPRGLIPGDAILLPSPNVKGGTALFLRSESTGYKVLGGGLVWMWPHCFLADELEPHQINLRLI